MTWSDSKGKPGCKCSTSHKSHRWASLDLNLHILGTDTFVYFSSCTEKQCAVSVCVEQQSSRTQMENIEQRQIQQPEIKKGRLMALINALFFSTVFFSWRLAKIYTTYLFYAIITFLNETVFQ